jgi:hypothetical protein
MKSRQLLVLVVAAIVFGGGGLWVLQQRSAGFSRSKVNMGSSLLGPFDGAAVTAVRLTQGSNVVNVVSDGQNWVVRERGNYPANVADLSAFVNKLAELKVARPVNVGASRLSLLQLTGDAVTVVELLDSDGKAVKTLKLGKQSTKGGGEEDPFGGGGYPDGRYVQVGETVALITDPLSNARPKPESWIARDFIKVEQPVSVTVTHPEATNSFALTRTNEFAEWTLSDAADGEVLDKNKLWSFNSLLSGASFNDLVLNADPAALGLDQPIQAAIQTAGGFHYDLKVGKPEGDNYPVQVTVRAELAKERTPGADEKPEDKAKLDKEFQEKLAKQEEKLKKEQALGKWTFTVSKYTVEPLLKTRRELLQEAKAGGAPSDDPPLPGELPQVPELPPVGN